MNIQHQRVVELCDELGLAESPHREARDAREHLVSKMAIGSKIEPKKCR
jgi:hypothetical protein